MIYAQVDDRVRKQSGLEINDVIQSIGDESVDASGEWALEMSGRPVVGLRLARRAGAAGASDISKQRT